VSFSTLRVLDSGVTLLFLLGDLLPFLGDRDREREERERDLEREDLERDLEREDLEREPE